MKTTAKLLSLLGASCLVAFASAAPAQAAPKPCCYNNGQYFESTPSTCTRYGGDVVSDRYCGRYSGYDRYDRYDRGPNLSIGFRVGDVFIAYNDGYYDHNRRWHRWRHTRDRDYYRRHYRSRYHDMPRDRDRRRHWRD
jgi:hypothetical protein